MSTFTVQDVMLATRDKRVVTPDQLNNEATKTRYFFLSRMWRAEERKYKGGDMLVDFIQGEEGDADYYNPKSSFSVTARNTLTQVSVPWAFMQGHYPIVNEHAKLNKGDTDAFVDEVMAQEQACMVACVNKMEDSLLGLPNYDLMEAASIADHLYRMPYSVPSLVTRDGGVPSSSNGGLSSGSSAWTTLQRVASVSSLTWYQNQYGTYDAADVLDDEDGLLPEFDEAEDELNYELPDLLSAHGNKSTSFNTFACLTNTDGLKMYKRVCRATHDRSNDLSNPAVPGPNFRGIPVKSFPALNNLGWTAGQPDYIWLDLSLIVPYYQTDNFFKETITPPSHEHPNKSVVWKFTWHNNLFRSRRHMRRTSAA